MNALNMNRRGWFRVDYGLPLGIPSMKPVLAQLDWVMKIQPAPGCLGTGVYDIHAVSDQFDEVAPSDESPQYEAVCTRTPDGYHAKFVRLECGSSLWRDFIREAGRSSNQRAVMRAEDFEALLSEAGISPKDCDERDEFQFWHGVEVEVLTPGKIFWLP